MIRIGKIVAAHGLAGNVIFSHFADNNSWLHVGDVLFIELNKGSYIPFFVDSVKALHEDEYLVNFEETATIEAAKKLVGKHVYVDAEKLQSDVKKTPLLWMGFNIVDRTLGSIGIVEDVYQTGFQWLATTHYEGKEVLIPLIDAMIIEVNAKNKFIRMDLPEGLLNL